jgi:hypothetical protein
MNFRQLLAKIEPNNTAFIVGNGINLYAESGKPNCGSCGEYVRCKDEKKRRFLSWSAVLKKLCDKRQICLDPEKPFDLSYPEIASLMNLCTLEQYTDPKTGNRSAKRDMRMEISGCYRVSKGQDIVHKQFINYMKNRNIPIITTNFDMLLSENLHEQKVGTGDPDLFKPSNRYIWNYCYNTTEVKDHKPPIDFRDSVDNFGIWYMHGNQKHPSSIVIGLEDYAGAIFQAKSMISLQSEGESRFGLYGAKDDLWIGRNTWLHLFFQRDLIFLGLFLDSQELFLRWLLVQRTNYLSHMKAKHKRPVRKAWYVHDDLCKLNPSTPKGIFFNACGVELIPNESHQAIYECFEPKCSPCLRD